jgi:ACS family tartrate transporter-like MFS transporter
LPQIVKGYKFSNLEISLIVAVPYLFASAAMIVWAWHIDRTGKKVAKLAIACFLGVVGLVASVLLTGSLLVALAGLTVALVGVTSARAIFWNVPTRFLTDTGAAGGLAFINTIGVFGGFVGPSMMGWLKDWTGSFTAGRRAISSWLSTTGILRGSRRKLAAAPRLPDPGSP